MDGERDTLFVRDELGIPGYEGATPIGAGGFGLVYRARQSAFDREVAVKVLASPMRNEDMRRRFARECKAIGSLSGHPHIVTVYESGLDRFGRPFISMDYMPGGSFFDRVQTNGPLPWGEVVDAGVKLAGAIATAHGAGILHRDVKPENVLLSAYGEPKLADFGISSASGASASRTGAITATLTHAAPETVSGGTPDERADVYSLGSSLFYLASGHPPFFLDDGEGLATLIGRILTDPPPDPRAYALPESLCCILQMALSKDPADRYQSAEEFGRALQEVQRAEGCRETELPLEDRPPRTTSLVGEWRPNRADDPNLTQRRLDRQLAASPPATPTRSHKGPIRVVAAVVALTLVGGAVAVLARERRDPARSAGPKAVERPAPTPRPAGDAVARPSEDEEPKAQPKRAGGERKKSKALQVRRHRGVSGRSRAFGHGVASGGATSGTSDATGSQFGGSNETSGGGSTGGGSTGGGPTGGGPTGGGPTGGGSTGGGSTGSTGGGDVDPALPKAPDGQPPAKDPIPVEPSALPQG